MTMLRVLPILSCCLLTLAVSAEGAEGDVITLTNGHVLTGTLVKTADTSAVYIETGTGIMALDRELVAQISQSFASRKASLAQDDYDGHLALARWAFLNQRSEEALKLIKPFAGSTAIDLEGLALLGRLTDEVEGALVALPIYQDYAGRGGKDPATLQRLAVIEAAKEQYDQQLAQVEAIKAGYEVPEGLEIKEGWTSEMPAYANNMIGSIELLPETTKNKGLKLSFTGGDKYKAVLRRAHKLDVRSTPILSMQVLNPTAKPLGFSIAVKCGDSWDYYESVAQTVPADGAWHELSFNLLEATYKCKKDGYKRHSYPVSDPSAIRETQFQIHNGRRDGIIWIDNLGYLPPP